MADIEIHFTEYFDGETVVISGQEGELHRAQQLKTDVRKGLARIVRLSAPAKSGALDFALGGSKEKTSATIDPARLRYVTVALANGRLNVSAISQEDFKREPRGYA